MQRVLEKFGVHPHQLRHTYCRELVGAGTVAELAGHADINVTRRYAKPSAKELGRLKRLFLDGGNKPLSSWNIVGKQKEMGVAGGCVYQQLYPRISLHHLSIHSYQST
ncbi:tyrosine-type recombinase/integrase [Marinithermofilum abyssi]|uniref:tyrosine-type recombinase/integrase n=1 Tax=Marinithermofilum abyssi TaxID=1571185 RepID=UPI00166C385E|nr:site-specific integrase [Marinithermofilum abyssi]